MAIHWQIKFRSLRNEILYTANIYDDSYTGTTPVQLTGAAVPFETQEDDNDDMFEPVRLQSGYLRINDTGEDADGNAFNWRDLIPTTDVDRPVTLTREDGTAVWLGFMQAQNFGALLYGNPQERAFPLQCPLTVTSRTDVDVLQTQIQNFAYILERVVESIPTPCRPTAFVIQGGAAAQAWLMKRVDWQNFATEDADGYLTAAYTMLELLEEVCRFWGWTARMRGTTLYLVSPDDTPTPDFLELTPTELHVMTDGGASGTIRSGFVPASFGSDIFASADNEDYQMRGPNKVAVTADGNCGHDNIIELYPEATTKAMFDTTPYSETYGDLRGLFTDDMNSFTSPLFTGQCISGNASFNIEHVASASLSGGVGGTDYNVIRIRPSYSGTEYVRIESVFSHGFYDTPLSGFSAGGISVRFGILRKGEKYEYANERGAGKSNVYLRLGVGETRNAAMWWTGSAWSATMTAFQVRIGDTWHDESGFAARTNVVGLHGKIFFDILGSNDMDHSGGGSYPDAFEMTNLIISFRRSYHVGISSVFDKFERATSREYTADNSAIVDNQRDEDLIFATDHDLDFGYAIVLNTDDTPFAGYDYDGGGTLTPPEQHLADRIIAYWQTSKRKLVCDLRADKIIGLTPKVVGTIDGARVYPVSISDNWRDETQHVVFMELPTTT